MPYSPVVFNEGEPLDPTKLNKLQESLTEVFKTSLSNLTADDTGSTTVPVIHFGQANSGALVANETKDVVLPIPSSFNPDLDILVMASVAQKVGGQIISVYARKDVGRGLAFVISNKNREDGVAINYIMIQKKAV
jgi:hypothetical protein